MSAKEKMDKVSELINLHSNTLDYLKKTERALINSIPITINNSSAKIFKSYRVHHSILRGKQKEAFFGFQMKKLR